MNLDLVYALGGVFTLLFLFYLCKPDQQPMSDAEFNQRLKEGHND